MFGGEKGDDLLPMVEDLIANNREVRAEHLEPDLWLASSAILDIFWDLHSWRKAGGMGGPSRIDLFDIWAYCNGPGFMLKSFEIRLVQVIDAIYMSHWKSPPAEG